MTSIPAQTESPSERSERFASWLRAWRAITSASGRALPSRLLAPMVFVVAVTTCLGLALKLHRIVLHPRDLGWKDTLALLLPEGAFALGSLASCVACAALFHALRLPWLALVLVQALGVLVILLHSLAHGYFLASGQTLDYGMTAFALGRAEETAAIVASEAHWPVVSVLAGACALVVYVPAWLYLRRARDGRGEIAPSLAPSLAIFVLGLGLGALCFRATALTPKKDFDRAFARDPISHLVSGGLRALLPEDPYRGTPTRLRRTGLSSLTRAQPDARKPNVVVIVLESTRADATTPYRRKLATTPFLDRFARESVKVERAYAVVPHTSKALVASLCGYEPEITLKVIEAEENGLPGKCLPELLAREGYDTAFFQAPTGRFENRRTLVRNLGIQTFRSGDQGPHRGLEHINYFGYEDAVMLEPSRKWLATRKANKPFFVTYLTNASHHPYDVPKHMKRRKYAGSATWNKYLNAVRYVDGVVERIVEQYRSAGLYEDTVFLIFGDHGEAFGEHGLRAHDDVMYEEGLRIPLLLRLPGGERGGTTVAGPVNELSIVPTLLGVLGYEVPENSYEARSFLEHEREPVLFASCYRSEYCAAVIRHPKKLVYYFDQQPALLFDLERDPGERTNIAGDHPGEVRAWSRELLDLRFAIHETYRDASRRALRRYVHRTQPAMAHPLRASFGPYLELLGYDLPAADKLRTFGTWPINRFDMSFYFHVKQPVPAGYALRVRVQGEREAVTLAHTPVQGLYPLSDWQAGEYIDDRHRFTLPSRWASPKLGLCLMLVDDDEVPVPARVAGDAEERPCVRITELEVVSSRK